MYIYIYVEYFLKVPLPREEALLLLRESSKPSETVENNREVHFKNHIIQKEEMEIKAESGSGSPDINKKSGRSKYFRLPTVLKRT